MPIGRSDGCLSTVWYQPRCAVVKTRPAQRNTDGGSAPRRRRTSRTVRCEQNGSHLDCGRLPSDFWRLAAHYDA